MRFRFSPKITVICSLLILGMIRASWWQWERHLDKQEYIKELESRLELPAADLIPEIDLIRKNPSDFSYRKMRVSGEFDFGHEIILRNRRHNGNPGSFVLTPLKIDGAGDYILVSRGFIPLAMSDREKRRIFAREPRVSFTGLIKESSRRRMFAPADPPSGGSNPRVDAWLRVDLPAIEAQLPYKLLPVYAEIMTAGDSEETKSKIIKSDSGRDEIFFLAGKSHVVKDPGTDQMDQYPVLVYDTVVPPDIHLGYVFEWALMALITLAICIILQFRRPKADTLPASAAS